ncbi:hypothetical protein BGX38DRAFT_1275887 [Terfezia claveryi]|nr:hypothetical protein BGX38DRAFT_1275887 [Terfezia claveryi]
MAMTCHLRSQVMTTEHMVVTETSPETLPEFMREGSVDEIYEAFLDPEVAVLAINPVGEQIPESITLDADSNSDSDMGSDNTATPARHLSPITPAEDIRSLGFGEIPDSQDQDSSDIDAKTVFQDCQEPEDTLNPPSFHEFRNEALVDIMSQDDATKDGEGTISRDDSVNDWNSRSALEGDRFDQLEITVYKTVSDKAADTQKAVSDRISAVQKTIADGYSSLAEVSRKEKEKMEEHSGILVNIANDISGHFETQREETKRGLLKLEEDQKEITNLYNNLRMVFNKHMRAQGLELIKLQEHLLAGFYEAVAAIKEEGRVSRAKDSEDRFKLSEAISEVYKETNTIKRAIEYADWHPYNTGSPSCQSSAAPKSPSPDWACLPGLILQPDATRWPYPHIRPPSRGEIINSSMPSPATTGSLVSNIQGTPIASPHLPISTRQYTQCTSAIVEPALPPLAATKSAAVSTPLIEIIDLSNIPDTPSPHHHTLQQNQSGHHHLLWQ